MRPGDSKNSCIFSYINEESHFRKKIRSVFLKKERTDFIFHKVEHGKKEFAEIMNFFCFKMQKQLSCLNAYTYCIFPNV